MTALKFTTTMFKKGGARFLCCNRLLKVVSNFLSLNCEHQIKKVSTMSYVLTSMTLSAILEIPPSRFQSLAQHKAIYNESHLKQLTDKISVLGISEFFCNPQSPITVTVDGRLKQGHHRTEAVRRLLDSGNLSTSHLTMKFPVLRDTVTRTTEQVASDVIVANRKQAQANEVNVLLTGTSRYTERAVNPAWKIFNKLFVGSKLLSKGQVAKIALPVAASMFQGDGFSMSGADLYQLYKTPMCKDAAVLLGMTNIPMVWSDDSKKLLTRRMLSFAVALQDNKRAMDLVFNKISTVYYTLFALALSNDYTDRQWGKVFKTLRKDGVRYASIFRGQFLNNVTEVSATLENELNRAARG